MIVEIIYAMIANGQVSTPTLEQRTVRRRKIALLESVDLPTTRTYVLVQRLFLWLRRPRSRPLASAFRYLADLWQLHHSLMIPSATHRRNCAPGANFGYL